MNNYFLNLVDSQIENALSRYLKYVIDRNINKISAADYIDGRLFLCGQILNRVNDKSYLLKNGVNVGQIVAPEKAIIFYLHSKQEISKPYLIDLKETRQLKYNIKKAFESKKTVDWKEIANALEENYAIVSHPKGSMRKKWTPVQNKVNLNASIEEVVKILVVDDEYEYFKLEIETAVKRKNPNWILIYAKNKQELLDVLNSKEQIDIFIVDIELTPSGIEGREILGACPGIQF